MAKKMTILMFSALIFFASCITSYADDGGFFSPFQTSDWIGLGLTGLADFADMNSSYSSIAHEQAIAWTPTTCPPSVSPPCFHLPGRGEGNPLITGLFGTRYPTALDYTAWGALELGVQTLVAWALPGKWRAGAWGFFIGIGAADTVMNSYGGGVTFRF